jgi:DNA-binding transcriptional MocR family regulator
MNDKLDDVWASRDFPVLREVTKRLDQGDHNVHAQALADATGLTPDDVQRALKALERRGYVKHWQYGDGHVMAVTEVSGSAYLITGLHPDGDDALSRLVNGLRQAADQTADEDERGRLRRAADALGGIARDIGVAVLTSVLTGNV